MQKHNLSEFAERRSIMDNDMMLPISVEEFAAYLDGNLSEDEMNRIDALASTNPNMEELISVSDLVDEDCQAYQQDPFALEAELTALEESDFDIPDIDANRFSLVIDNAFDIPDVASASDSETVTTELDIASSSCDNDISSIGKDDADSGEILMDPSQDQSEEIIDDNSHSLGDTGDITIGNDFLDS